ncbi:MAG: U32 family peptidase [Planctomycetia bacterium]|nr:U32 family peptidase [Planctomycetia bacterium]
MKIMAPAGDAERLMAAIRGGADEVYMGLTGFGARRFAKNFQVDEFCQSIDLAHRNNVTLHLTLNTILSEAELDSVLPDVSRLAAAGLDAVIVQDFGVARRLRELLPTLPLCASTQLSCSRPDEAQFLQQQGFSRVVLARELDFDEIKAIRDQSTIELEVFTSGALCLGASGKCFLSSFIGGRSGNRGMCAQPCRHRYLISHPSQNSTPGYYLSLADQWQEQSELARLFRLGVDSIKIEGRMKSPVYVYEAVRYYRGLLDSLEEEASGKKTTLSGRIRRVVKDMPADDLFPSQIAPLFNRGYAKGYLYEHDPHIINSQFSSNFGVELGPVEGMGIRLERKVRLGDGIVYLNDKFEKISGGNVSQIDVLDERTRRRCRATEAEAGRVVCFDSPPPPDAVIVYKTNDHSLNRELNHRIAETKRYCPITVKLQAHVGKPLSLTLTHARATIQKNATTLLEPARKIPSPENSTQQVLFAALDRFGDSPFYPQERIVDADENVFVPKSLLNQLRQEATAALEEAVLNSWRRPELNARIVPPSSLFVHSLAKANTPNFEPDFVLSACVRTPEQRRVCEQFGIPRIYSPTTPLAVNRPQYPANSSATDQAFEPLAGTLDEALLFESRGISYASDWTFNVGNIHAAAFLIESLPNLTTIFLSPELSANACEQLAKNIRRYIARPIRIALPVYGRLTAMFTRKTLFDSEVVQLQDELGHNLLVAKNNSWYPEGKGMTGSTLFLENPLDILCTLPKLQSWSFNEARLDFTFEDEQATLAILERAVRPTREIMPRFSYGFEHGIF